MFFFWVAFLTCDSETLSKTLLEGGTFWISMKKEGEGISVEEKEEKTSVEEKEKDTFRISHPTTFFLLYKNGFGNYI